MGFIDLILDNAVFMFGIFLIVIGIFKAGNRDGKL